MRLQPRGTALITGAKPADISVAAGLVKTPTGAADGVWVKVQPFTVGTVPAGHLGNPLLTKSGLKVWVQRNDVSATGEVGALGGDFTVWTTTLDGPACHSET